MARVPDGVVNNFFDQKSVAKIKLHNSELHLGDVILFKGNKTNFQEPIESMHVDDTPAESASIGDEVCVKTSSKVRKKDRVFIIRQYRIFLSYEFSQEKFVRRVNYYLMKQLGFDTFCYPGEELRNPANKNYNWQQQIGTEITKANRFVFFSGKTLGFTQELEAQYFNKRIKLSSKNGFIVKLPDHAALPEQLFQIDSLKEHEVLNTNLGNGDVDDGEAINCAKKITTHFSCESDWIDPDGLPHGYPFDYEKVIIKEYFEGGGKLDSIKRLEQGCPERWPKIEKIEHDDASAQYNNPILSDEIGKYRPDDWEIIVDTRTKYHSPGASSKSNCLKEMSITFPEAGPREKLLYPINNDNLNVGILVSGGIAPGINSVIRGIIERHCLYRNAIKKDQKSYVLDVIGYRNGFSGLMRNEMIDLVDDQGEQYVMKNHLKNISNQGGSILGTSRYRPLLNFEDKIERNDALDDILDKLQNDRIDILYIIGGDGSMRAAHMLWTRIKQRCQRESDKKEISIVAVPKTMDNDILWVWQSFGFLSAVEKAKEFVVNLHTEAKSNPRLCIVQLFGSDSGFVVSHAALASAVCDAVLIPETDFSMNILSNYIKKRLNQRHRPGRRSKGSSPYGIILMAETAIPNCFPKYDGYTYLDDPEIGLEQKERDAIEKFIREDRRVQGQTPDALRRGGIKIISRFLQKEIRNMDSNPSSIWRNFRVFTNEPRHLIRAMDPSSHDIIYCQRLGILAVDNAMAGFTDFMISQWVTEFVLVPLKLVVLGRKRVTKDGIFWKSVLANTGQPAKLT